MSPFSSVNISPANTRLFSLFLLLSTATPTMAQRSPSLDVDPITMGRIVVYSIFFVIFLAFTFLTFVALSSLVNHRTPYISLLLATFLIAIELATHVVELVLTNLSPFVPPLPVINAMISLNAFSGYWSWMAVFMTVVMVLHDRLKACDELSASEKVPRTGSSDIIMPMVPSSSNISNRRGSRGREFMAVHVILSILIVSLGTATAALITKLNDDRINRRIQSSREFRQRVDVINRVFYAFNSFVIFTVVDVLALAMYTLRRWKAKRMTDQVLSTVIRITVPFFLLLILNRIIFTILFSPNDLNATTTGGIAAIDRATLANAVLNQALLVGTTAPIVLLGLSKQKWRASGERYDASPSVRYIIRHPHFRA